jgi:hypothetical protein
MRRVRITQASDADLVGELDPAPESAPPEGARAKRSRRVSLNVVP